MPDLTTNYNLKKPLGTENYNVEDQNDNMDIIDTQMKTQADATAAHLAETAKVGSFTRSTTLASGTQAITGLGFKPKSLLFFATVDSLVGRMSMGIVDNALNQRSVADNYNTAANTYIVSSVVPISIRQGANGSISYVGQVASFDADGFTVNWTKGANAIDGETITVSYMAFRS